MRNVLLASAAALMLLPVSAKADTFVTLGGQQWNITNTTTITVTDAVPSGNQVKNLPCVICGDNQPLQPTGFGYNDFGNTGNQTDLKFFSSGTVDDKTLGPDTLSATNYSGAFLDAFLAALGDQSLTFSIGLDVNDTSQAQTLSSFFFLDVTTHTVLSAMTTDTLVPDINNGTGFPDYTLTGLSLAGVNPGDQLAFFARITNANDGPDSFFLVAAPQAVPGPIVGAGIPGLIAAGMFMVGLARRRRKNAAAV